MRPIFWASWDVHSYSKIYSRINLVYWILFPISMVLKKGENHRKTVTPETFRQKNSTIPIANPKIIPTFAVSF